LAEPSRPQNPYWLWLGENRESLTKEAGSGKGSAVGKLAGQKWKTMSEAAKKPYEKKAEALKQEYEQKMADFVAAGGVKGKRRAEKAEAKAAKGSKKARKEARAASDQPKRPPSGYWVYSQENREVIEKEAGTKKLTLVASLAGKKWKAMSDAQKKPFEDKAAMAKVEYQKAMEEWKKNGGGQEDGDEEEEDEGEEEQ